MELGDHHMKRGLTSGKCKSSQAWGARGGAPGRWLGARGASTQQRSSKRAQSAQRERPERVISGQRSSRLHLERLQEQRERATQTHRRAGRRSATTMEAKLMSSGGAPSTAPSAPGMSGYLAKMGGIRQNW